MGIPERLSSSLPAAQRPLRSLIGQAVGPEGLEITRPITALMVGTPRQAPESLLRVKDAQVVVPEQRVGVVNYFLVVLRVLVVKRCKEERRNVS